MRLAWAPAGRLGAGLRLGLSCVHPLPWLLPRLHLGAPQGQSPCRAPSRTSLRPAVGLTLSNQVSCGALGGQEVWAVTPLWFMLSPGLFSGICR